MKTEVMRSAALTLLIAAGAAFCAGAATVRERLADGWLFMRADGSANETNSAAWRPVRVPHDWGVEKSFDMNKPYGDAYLDPAGVGWYRYRFTPRPDEAARLKGGGRVFFESNGAMSNAKVWINGRHVGGWAYGYTPFRCELTPHVVADGENEIVVRCENEADSSRWYTGGGLYRECRLAWCDADYLVPGSVAITTRDVGADEATVDVRYEMSLSGRRTRTFKVEKPVLWDIDNPHLYTVEIEGEPFRYGIRTISFHADERGFQLNGRRVMFNGVCLHHDLGVIGAAYSHKAMKRRLLKLKEAGVNAIRCAHNEEDPDFLDLCDELGLLVKDEIFDCWRHTGFAGKRPNGYNKLFEEWHERDVRAWVRADRNHPSVIMWSLGNEICDGFADIAPVSEFIATGRELAKIAREEDPTRPTTNANNNPANATNEFAEARVFDIYGFNYHGWMFGEFAKKFPDVPFFSSESQCMSSTRGEYTFPVKWGWTQVETLSPFVSGYGVEACEWGGDPGEGWAMPPDAHWHWMDANPACMGEFVWTGWDYLGGPFWVEEMAKKNPSFKGIHSCNTGFFDLAGFRKDTFYLYQSRWRPEVKMAHIVPHWNWLERIGKTTPVHVFTTGDEGELFLNGRSLGRRRKDPSDFRRAYRLAWDDVVYEPGELKVVVYRKGKKWAKASVATTGEPSRMRLECEGDSVLSDGDDLMFVNLSVLDAEGRVVPRAKNEVVFTVEGPAEIVATDNGDETDFDSFKSPSRRAFNGRLQAVLRAHPGASGLVTIRAESPGLAGAYAMFRVGGDLRPKARMGLSTPTGRKTETLNWRSARGGETHNMLVVHPKSAPAKPAPLFVALHGHGASIVGNYRWESMPIDPDGKCDICWIPEDFYGLILEVRDIEDFWGIPKSCVVPKDKEGGLTPVPEEVSETERRVLEQVEWAASNLDVDRNRIYLGGASMGGSGSMGIGLPNGDVFAAVKANVSACPYHVLARLGLGGELRQVPDPPPLVEYSAQDDRWSRDKNLLYEGMDAARYAIFAYWGPFGHTGRNSKVLPKNDLVGSFNVFDVRLDEPYVAFSSASCNDPMPWPDGFMDKKHPLGLASGQRNAYFRWGNAVDNADAFEVDLRLLAASEWKSRRFKFPESAFADVTPRRMVHFDIGAGERIAWEYDGKRGESAADETGHVTIPRLEITVAPRRLKLARTQPQTGRRVQRQVRERRQPGVAEKGLVLGDFAGEFISISGVRKPGEVDEIAVLREPFKKGGQGDKAKAPLAVVHCRDAYKAAFHGGEAEAPEGSWALFVGGGEREKDSEWVRCATDFANDWISRQAQ